METSRDDLIFVTTFQFACFEGLTYCYPSFLVVTSSAGGSLEFQRTERHVKEHYGLMKGFQEQERWLPLEELS